MGFTSIIATNNDWILKLVYSFFMWVGPSKTLGEQCTSTLISPPICSYWYTVLSYYFPLTNACLISLRLDRWILRTLMKWNCSRMTSCTSLVLRIVCLIVRCCVCFCENDFVDIFRVVILISCMDFEDYPQTGSSARKPNTNTKVSEGGSEEGSGQENQFVFLCRYHKFSRDKCPKWTDMLMFLVYLQYFRSSWDNETWKD